MNPATNRRTPHPALPGLLPEESSRLAVALVERWVGTTPGPEAAPQLCLWTYGVAGARLQGMWSAPHRRVRQLDPWLCADVVRRLLAGADATPTTLHPLLVWARPGRAEVRSDDLAWHTATWSSWPTRSTVPPLLVVTRRGWVTVPAGVVGHRRASSTG